MPETYSLPRIEQLNVAGLHILHISRHDCHLVDQPDGCKEAVDDRHFETGFFGRGLYLTPHPRNIRIDADDSWAESFYKIGIKPIL